MHRSLVAFLLLASLGLTLAYHPRCCSGITHNSLKSRYTSTHVRSGSSSGSGKPLQAFTDINFGLSDGGVGAVVGLAEAIAIGGGVYLLCQLAA
jgi:Na+/alanine symporter